MNQNWRVESGGAHIVEVDVEDGMSKMKKVGVLKHEAKTLAHIKTHRYRNPYCEACVRAKMRHFRTRRGAFQRDPKKWGDLLTFDFVDVGRARAHGILDEKEMLVMRDVATGVVGVYPTTSRSTDEVIDSIKRFAGGRKVRLAYTDKAPEFEHWRKERISS